MRRIRGLIFLIICSGIFPVFAERSGDFEISVQQVNDEDARVVGQSSSNVMTRSMTQNLVYKVRIEYKGLDKLKNVQVYYVLSYRPNQSKPRFIKGDTVIPEVGPQGKIEFNTTAAENIYTEQTNEGLRYKVGRSRLDGISIRIFADKERLTEWAQPKEADKYWDDPSVKTQK
jgi:hypothetical protein